MITIRGFVRRTLDPIEKLYAKKICSNVPNYIKFWDDFIDGRLDQESGMIKPYDYVFPAGFQDPQKAWRIIYTIIMLNFTIFTNIAGAHFQLENLRKALKLSSRSKKRHFLHWEAFEIGYVRLGNISYYITSIWGKMRKLDTSIIEKKILEYLDRHGRSSVAEKLRDIYGDSERDGPIRIYRNNFVHFSRNLRLKFSDGYYYVPVYLGRRLTWLDQLEYDRFARCDIKLEKDIEKVEIMFNEIEGFFYDSLEKYICNNGITIRR